MMRCSRCPWHDAEMVVLKGAAAAVAIAAMYLLGIGCIYVIAQILLFLGGL